MKLSIYDTFQEYVESGANLRDDLCFIKEMNTWYQGGHIKEKYKNSTPKKPCGCGCPPPPCGCGESKPEPIFIHPDHCDDEEDSCSCHHSCPPPLSVVDVDGIKYWTWEGRLLVDCDGNFIPTSGQSVPWEQITNYIDAHMPNYDSRLANLESRLSASESILNNLKTLNIDDTSYTLYGPGVIKFCTPGCEIGPEPEPNYYLVIRNLTNCSIDNVQDRILENTAYNATVTANDGYILKSVIYTVGSESYTAVNGVINIASVTGNITITALAEEAPTLWNISYSGDHFTAEPMPGKIKDGDPLNIAFTADNGYVLKSIYYYTNNIGRTVEGSNVLYLEHVTDDVRITVTMEEETGPDERTLIGLRVHTSSPNYKALTYNSNSLLSGNRQNLNLWPDAFNIPLIAVYRKTSGETEDVYGKYYIKSTESGQGIAKNLPEGFNYRFTTDSTVYEEGKDPLQIHSSAGLLTGVVTAWPSSKNRHIENVYLKLNNKTGGFEEITIGTYSLNQAYLNYTITFILTPTNSVLTIDGNVYEERTYTGVSGTSINVSVSAPGYVGETQQIILDGNKVIRINLIEESEHGDISKITINTSDLRYREAAYNDMSATGGTISVSEYFYPLNIEWTDGYTSNAYYISSNNTKLPEYCLGKFGLINRTAADGRSSNITVYTGDVTRTANMSLVRQRIGTVQIICEERDSRELIKADHVLSEIDVYQSASTFSVNWGDTTLDLNESVQANAIFNGNDVTDIADWTSSKETVIAFSSEEGNEGLYTAYSYGAATLTCSFGTYIQKSVIARVSEQEKVFTVNIPETLTVGDTDYLYADLDGVEVTNECEWLSDNPGIVSVSGRQITGVAEGQATITCNYGSYSKTGIVIVTELEPTGKNGITNQNGVKYDNGVGLVYRFGNVSGTDYQASLIDLGMATTAVPEYNSYQSAQFKNYKDDNDVSTVSEWEITNKASGLFPASIRWNESIATLTATDSDTIANGSLIATYRESGQSYPSECDITVVHNLCIGSELGTVLGSIRLTSGQSVILRMWNKPETGTNYTELPITNIVTNSSSVFAFSNSDGTYTLTGMNSGSTIIYINYRNLSIPLAVYIADNRQIQSISRIV